MVLTRRQARTSAFESIINNDILETIAGFAECKDLVNLSLTSKHLSSSVEEVAVRMINSSDVRYGGEDEDLPALQELNYLRSPIEFTDLLGNRIGYVGRDKACVYSSNPNRLHSPYYIVNQTMETGDMDWEGTEQTAICGNYVMRSGKHYAKFTISTCDPIVVFRYVYCRIGIMRPISSTWKEDAEWSMFSPLHTPWFNDFLVEKTDEWGDSNVHCCLYYDFEGTCEWSNWEPYPEGKKEKRWDGMRGFDIYDGELGLLLDLDEGTLTVYKDGTRLGVMMDGLSGEYTWVVEITAQANGPPVKQNVRIERAHIPTSSVDDSSSSEEDDANGSSSSSEEDESESEAEKESSSLESDDSDESGGNVDLDKLTEGLASSSSSEYDTDD